MHLQEHKGPGGCAVEPGQAVSAHPRVCFTRPQVALSQGLGSEPRLLSSPWSPARSGQ